jgi:hypothetical protein
MHDRPMLAARAHRLVSGPSLVALLLLVTAGAAAQAPPLVAYGGDALPFTPGEHLTYRVRSDKFGNVGHGTMSVEGPVDARGMVTWLLRSEMHARVGIVRASERAESWLDPARMLALRFRKRERRAFLGHEAQVELFPEERRWEGQKGKSGESPTSVPLDELSFIYYVRTLPLDTDTLMRVVRHYDPERNPVEVRVIRRDSLLTEAGPFHTIVVEMRVKERGHFDGQGTIRLHLSDDARRLPVRIESNVPVLGQTTLTLERLEMRPPAADSVSGNR